MGSEENTDVNAGKLIALKPDHTKLSAPDITTLDSETTVNQVGVDNVACSEESNQDECAQLSVGEDSASFVCNKRPISPGTCHPSARQPKMRKTELTSQDNDINTNESSQNQFADLNDDLQELSQIYNSCENASSANVSETEKLNNIPLQKDVETENIKNLLKKAQWKEVRIELKDIKYNSNFKVNPINKNVYEVEKILGKKIECNVTYYLIQWKNWAAEYNTWEPLEHLTNCSDLLKEFEDGRLKTLERFQKYMNFYPNVTVLEKHMKNLLKNGVSIDSSLSNTDRLYEWIDKFFNTGPSKCKRLAEKIKENILHMFLYNARTDQLASLEDWESEMNSITKGKPSIKVENLVDLERAPQEFLYIDDYLPGVGVIIPDDPPIGCECSTCDYKTKCCYALCDGCLPYTSACRIRVCPGTPIYECNKRCICPANCQNRVVQRGSQMKLCVFRTSNGRGWGVKTLRVIKKGTFVIQYVGEVITNEEADKRGKEYDAAGRTYLFDLDYNESEEPCPYTVDAAVYGNISHFINHSCDPNLAVYAVWINCLDPNLPKLALFATKDIKQNEEITFDYMRPTAKDELQRPRFGLPGECTDEQFSGMRTLCKCGAKVCRKYLFK